MLSKKILLAGIAAGALAAAGSASALTISASTVSGVTTTTLPYGIAQEASATTLTTTAATTTTVSATSLLSAGSYVLTYNYTGITGFATGVAAPALAVTGGTGCTANSSTLSSGGTSSSQSVSYLITIGAAGCTANPTFVLTAPFTTAGPVAVNVSASLTSTNNVAVDNSPTAVAKLVLPIKAFNAVATAVVPNGTALDVTANGTTITGVALPTTLALGTGATPYTSFVTGAGFDQVLGVVGYLSTVSTTTSAPYIDLSGAGTSLASQVVPNFTASIGGNFTGLTTTLNTGTCGTAGTQVAASTSGPNAVTFTNVTTTEGATSPGGTIYNVCVAATGTSTQLAGGAYNATVAPSTSVTGASNLAVVNNASLEPILLQGTNITAPWVGDGTNGYQGIIRISNLSNVAVTNVTASLLNPVNVTSTSSGICTIGSLPGSGSLTISSSQLQACFGNFGNSDVRVTLTSAATNVAAKLRIINASTGVVTEQSLGTGQGTTFGVVGTATTTIQ